MSAPRDGARQGRGRGAAAGRARGGRDLRRAGRLRLRRDRDERGLHAGDGGARAGGAAADRFDGGELHGRHDPCIVPRAVPCVEAAAAIAVLDAALEAGIWNL